MMLYNQLAWSVFPFLEQEARRIVREKPGISDTEFDHELHERVKARQEQHDEQIAALHQVQFKKGRDRKSNPKDSATAVL
jgi:hypothetical protein